jgi:ring-1,2-phenylacetyl-CoA epoxidase subunit PaaE
MAKFHTITVKEVRRETSDAVSVAFLLPDELKEEFKFKQGQYITLKLNLNGEELRRSYSICSSPFDGDDLRVAIKKVNGGRVSNYINADLKAGDRLEVMTPMGNFYSELNATNHKNYVLFAGGSGITPMMSIIKAVFDKEPNSKISLFYGNLNESATIFKGELDSLSSQYAEKLKVYYIFDKPENTNWPALQTGIMDQAKVNALIENHVGLNYHNEFFICGPTPMMDNVRMVLEKLQIKKESIHVEYFTASLEASKTAETDNSAEITAQVTVIMYGMETEMELSSKGKTVLDAALDAGVDVPFACKGAVCCTCRAKIIEGKVKMDANFALTEEEVAQGYILTCQAHPVTPVVKIDYDAI